MRTTRILAMSVLVAFLGSCGGNDGGPSTHVLKIEKWPPSGDNQTDTAGNLLPKVIRVKVTVNDNVVAGYMVHFDGGDLGTDSMLTGADGIATSTWTLSGAVGTQFVTASLDSAEGSPLTFHATAVAGAPSILSLVSGDSQVVKVSTFFDDPLVFKLADQFGNGVAGRFIRFTAGNRVTLGADSIQTSDQGLVSLNLKATTRSGKETVVGTFGTVTGSPLSVAEWIVPSFDTVFISDAGFSPDTLSVSAGAAVYWQWVTGNHSVTPDSAGAFPGSSTFEPPHVYGPVIFGTPGMFPYHDVANPGLTGVIKVN